MNYSEVQDGKSLVFAELEKALFCNLLKLSLSANAAISAPTVMLNCRVVSLCSSRYDETRFVREGVADVRRYWFKLCRMSTGSLFRG